MFRTLFAAVFLSLYVLVVGPPLLLYALAVGNGRLLYRAALGGVMFAVRAVGMKVRVEGLEHVPPGPCLFAANHTSAADPPAVVSAIPRQVAILVKQSLWRIPIAGQTFRLVNFVPVNRADREAAIASAERATEALRKGTSFLIYPEGTRSPDGRLQVFKKGAVLMAIKAGVPIVPIACAGAHRVMQKHSLIIHPGEIVVRFCPAVDASCYSVEQRDELNAVVRAAIAEALPPDQRPLDLPPSAPEL